MTTVQTQIPDQLLQQAQYLVQQGWAPWMDLSLPSMALDTRFPAGMTSSDII
jgi:hypothetical protein